MNPEPQKSISLVCKQCRSRVQVPSDPNKAYVHCTNCGAKLMVPGRAQQIESSPPADGIEELHAPAEPAEEILATEELQVSAPVQRSQLTTDALPEKYKSQIERELQAEQAKRPPPALVFVSGVFTFPWRVIAIRQWLLLSAGFALEFLVAALVVPTLTGGLSADMGTALAGLPILVWISALVLPYATGSLLAVIEFTAFNIDDDYDWPEAGWRDRFWSLLHVGLILVLSSLPAIVVALLVSQAGGWFWTPVAVATCWLFPILLLSSLETDSAAWPVSWLLWWSLPQVWRGWSAFYIVSAVWLGATAWAVMALGEYATSAGALLVGPILATSILVYARLLGRMAWLVDQRAKKVFLHDEARQTPAVDAPTSALRGP